MMTFQFPIPTTSHASEPRRVAADRARELGFDEARAGTVALVASELATNLALHASDGEMLISELSGVEPAVELLAIDRGPGMSDVGRAMEDGYSTSGTLGHGLGSVARQSDDFEVFSRQPGGTVAMARISRRTGTGTPRPAFKFAGVSVAHRGEQVCGDDWAANWRNTQGELLVADGLGHGIAAAEAAGEATRIFRGSRNGSAPALVDELHRALRHTRGAAVAVASLDLELEIVKFAGLGNIGASIVTPERKRVNLVSQNGTAGHVARRVTEFSYPFRAGSVLVMFSDGLGSSWDPAAYPGLWSRDPALIAGVLYRDFSRRRDDVTVVVGTQCS